jgi:predicted nucleic acid-binding protein
VILADTSVWIDHLRGTGSAHARRLQAALGEREVVLGDLIVMEIIQGLRDEASVGRVRASLSQIPSYRLVHRGIPLKAANNYRALRQRGFTPRNAIDTIIATYCIEHRLELLHNDRDFDPFERHLGLRTVAVA